MLKPELLNVLDIDAFEALQSLIDQLEFEKAGTLLATALQGLAPQDAHIGRVGHHNTEA